MHLNQTKRFAPTTSVMAYRNTFAVTIFFLFIFGFISGEAVSSVSPIPQPEAHVTKSANSKPTVQSNAGDAHNKEKAEPESPWGVTVIGVRRTASDYMLEFRYRVVNAEKAAYLMNRKIKPELIIEKTGHKLQVPVSPKIGPLRQSPKFARENRNYFMFFANPGRSVKAGDKVTVVIGDFKVQSLVLE